MESKTILIVEDNPVNRKLLVVVLRIQGYRLLTAEDGEEAIEVAAREQPDLILMDLQLPKMNGFAATAKLKDQPITAHIPIIALTAHAALEEQLQGQRSNFEGYITKPIDTRSFPAQIRGFLDRR